MPALRDRLFLYATPLIALACLYLAFARHDSQYRLLNTLNVGGIFGTFFGHTAVAAGWAAFGPGPVLWRIPLSLVWMVLLCISWESNLVRQAQGAQGAGGVMAVCLFVQWLLLQIPFAVSKFVGTRLARIDETRGPQIQKLWQFSVRQLITLTGIVCACVGVGRILAPTIQTGWARVGEWSFYVPLTGIAACTSLPLVMAMLLPKRSMIAAVAAFAWIAMAVCLPTPISEPRNPNRLPPMQMAAMFAVMALWIVALEALVRLAGYRLLIPRLQSSEPIEGT